MLLASCIYFPLVSQGCFNYIKKLAPVNRARVLGTGGGRCAVSGGSLILSVATEHYSESNRFGSRSNLECIEIYASYHNGRSELENIYDALIAS